MKGQHKSRVKAFIILRTLMRKEVRPGHIGHVVKLKGDDLTVFPQLKDERLLARLREAKPDIKAFLKPGKPQLSDDLDEIEEWLHEEYLHLTMLKVARREYEYIELETCWLEVLAYYKNLYDESHGRVA